MGNIMVRMGVVIGILVAVQMGFFLVGRLAHPVVVEPQRPIKDFPMVVNTPAMGTWEGKDVKMDDRTFNEAEVARDPVTGDQLAVSRTYTKEGRVVKLLLAEYGDPGRGLYHNPMNCYRSNGFTLLGDVERHSLNAADRPDTKVSVSNWERKNEKVIVAYWYEIGDYSMYERQDLLPTQWKMKGKSKWPVMFKVLLEVEVPADGPVQAKVDILDMAQFIRQWLGQIQPVVD